MTRGLRLQEVPPPPLFTLAGEDGEDVFAERPVAGVPATVGVLFESRALAEEFSAGAAGFGMGAFAGLGVRELPDRGELEAYAAAGADYVLVVSESGTGLFHAGDLARLADEGAGAVPLPLYLFSDERGEAPLISVEAGGEEDLVVALFSSPERARAFRQRAAHLELPDRLATIEDRDGLRRHALVAREAGAHYAVIDPEAGPAGAIPVEDLIR